MIAPVSWVSCDTPDDRLFDIPVVEPVEIVPGLLRLTFNEGPDVVRGFDLTGTVVMYRSRGLAGFGDDWRLLAAPVRGGPAEEVAALYRQALLNPPGAFEAQATRRIFTVWRGPGEGAEACRGCPSPAVVIIAIIRLELTDGKALSALPMRAATIATYEPTSEPAFRRIRLTPADMEVQVFGTNPYGPAIPAGSDTGYYSDGQTLWRFDLARPAIPVDSVGAGAFPAVSPDGRLLAAAVPFVTDSSGVICGAQACTQETVTFTLAEWRVNVIDLESQNVRDLGPGLEPRFHPTESRLLVRRLDGLHWVDLAEGVSDSIPDTGGAFASVIAPDGSRLAFSTNRFGNSDVFVLTLDR